MPLDGENVTIPGPWTVLMDVNPAIMTFWLIDGDVIIPTSIAAVHIIAQSVWVRQGSIQAGTSTTPFPGNITF